MKPESERLIDQLLDEAEEWGSHDSESTDADVCTACGLQYFFASNHVCPMVRP